LHPNRLGLPEEIIERVKAAKDRQLFRCVKAVRSTGPREKPDGCEYAMGYMYHDGVVIESIDKK
jgi:hypothetical protein